MKKVLILFSLFSLLVACKGTEVKPGEVAATITGDFIADNWTKGCSSGGLAIKINRDSYIISNRIPAAYEEPNSWPAPVWIRYERDVPDPCTQADDRIKILSIRKR